MHLIALLIGLIIERLATQLFHWRRMRWLDRIIDAGLKVAQRLNHWPALIPVLLLVALLVLPVFAVMYTLGDTLQGFTYLILAVAVLLVSLGPRDIGEEVVEYCEALREGDDDKIRAAAKAIIEGEVPNTERELIGRVEAAVCVQANNRLFAVIFWFVVLGAVISTIGPLAAWTYRVTDLVRRRIVFNAARDEQQDRELERIREAAESIHALLAWVPARLTAFGYAAAGHADEAIAALRAPTEERNASMSEQNEHLLARVGVAALALHDGDDETVSERGIRGAMAANKLVFRLLLIWAVVIAAMTLYGFTR
ncbi:MAG: regulatory signaling modulator protein AmpE [Gammaproteobacteria bacterium]|nr:regulatory signaling modulator protein AmpE [Gammaproteobacteria bacterium]